MMAERLSPSLIWSAVGMAVSLFVPSAALFEHYFGIGGVVVYALSASILLVMAISILYLKIWSTIEDKLFSWQAVATVVLLLLFVVVMYPLANSGRFGPGSDGDDALFAAASDLLQGKYPYQGTTYLGNTISPLPGAVILSIPFVLLGNVAYQNVFWLAILYLASGRMLRDGRQALLLLWTLLLLSPIIARGLAVGSDYTANSIYVVVFALWVIQSYSSPAATWQKFVASILLGVAFSSRANFLLILPLLLSVLISRVGWKEAVKAASIIIISFIAVTLPVYLWDPGAFSPLYSVNEVGKFRDVLPAADFLIPMLSAVAALALALRDNSRITHFLGHSAIVQAVPVFSGILLSSLRAGKVTFAFSGFGIFFLFFGALASWPGVWRLANRSDSH